MDEASYDWVQGQSHLLWFLSHWGAHCLRKQLLLLFLSVLWEWMLMEETRALAATAASLSTPGDVGWVGLGGIK